jgi:acyl carrier protein
MIPPVSNLVARNRTSGERDASQPQVRDQTEPSAPNATNTFNSGEAEQSNHDILARIEPLLVSLMPEVKRPIPATASFAELGMDSLNLVDLLVAAEAEFGVAVPDEELGNFRTVEDLVTFVSADRLALP